MPLITRREAAQALFDQMFPEVREEGRAPNPKHKELEYRVTNCGLMIVRIANLPPVRYFGSLKTTDQERES
jgi:hypothetical protein